MTKNVKNEKIELLNSHINALRAENEILRDENETYFETNEALIEQIQELKKELRHYKAKNIALTQKLQNVTLWDLSPEAQEEAGHLLAKSLLGGK